MAPVPKHTHNSSSHTYTVQVSEAAVSTLDMQSAGCKVCGLTWPPKPPGEAVDVPGHPPPSRAAPD